MEKERRLCAGRAKAGAAADAGGRDTRLGGELVLVAMGAGAFIAENAEGPPWEGRYWGRQTTRPNGSLIRSSRPTVPERFPTARVLRVSLVPIVLMPDVPLSSTNNAGSGRAGEEHTARRTKAGPGGRMKGMPIVGLSRSRALCLRHNTCLIRQPGIPTCGKAPIRDGLDLEIPGGDQLYSTLSH